MAIKNSMKRIKTYKGWIIAQDAHGYYVFSVDEWSYGEGYWTPEFECCSVQECMDNINSY